MSLLNHAHIAQGRPTMSLSTPSSNALDRGPYAKANPLTLHAASSVSSRGRVSTAGPSRRVPNVSHMALAEHRDGVERLGFGLGASRDVHERLHHLPLRREGGCCPVFEGI